MLRLWAVGSHSTGHRGRAGPCVPALCVALRYQAGRHPGTGPGASGRRPSGSHRPGYCSRLVAAASRGPAATSGGAWSEASGPATPAPARCAAARLPHSRAEAAGCCSSPHPRGTGAPADGPQGCGRGRLGAHGCAVGPASSGTYSPAGRGRLPAVPERQASTGPRPVQASSLAGSSSPVQQPPYQQGRPPGPEARLPCLLPVRAAVPGAAGS